MAPYRIIIRNSRNWREHKAATLGVSVASPNWQGDKFASILDFCESNFDTIRVDVTDALYRYNFMAEGISPDEALAKANAMGALWLVQHQDIIDNCRIKPSVIRWAEWYGHRDYEEVFVGFQHAHRINSLLNEAVHEDAMEFYRRRQQKPTTWQLEKSKDFMIEELAVITLQARELPCLKVYPGEELKCFNVVRQGLVPEAPKGLENEQFAKIKFAKRGADPLPIAV